MPINRIRQILNLRERSVAFFTRGQKFIAHPNNTGSTGAWLLSSKKVRNGFYLGITVVVYLRLVTENAIWRGKCSGVIALPPDPKGRTRYRLNLVNLNQVDTANTNWFDCTQTRRQDFTYFNC